MKKTNRIISGLLAAVLLLSATSCGEGEGINEEEAAASQNVDFQKNMHQANVFMLNSLCETDEGIYFYYDRLCFIDKKSGAVTVVCGKPDCTHQNGDCNALIDSDSMWESGGRLYYTTEDYEDGERVNYVYSIGLDGSGRRRVQQLDPKKGGDNTIVVNDPVFHRGYVYFEYNDVIYRSPLGGSPADAETVWGTDAGDAGNKTVGNLTVYGGNRTAYEMWADGDYFYFMTDVADPDGTSSPALFAYDTNTGEVNEAWTAPSVDVVGEYEGWDKTISGSRPSMSQWYVSGGYIYLFFSANGLWRCKLGTEEYEKLADTTEHAEYGSAVFFDGGMILLNDMPEWSDILGRYTFGGGHIGGDKAFVYGLDGSFKNELSLDVIADEFGDVSSYDFLAVSDGCLYLIADVTEMSDYESDGNVGMQMVTSQRKSMFRIDTESGECMHLCDLQ